MSVNRVFKVALCVLGGLVDKKPFTCEKQLMVKPADPDSMELCQIILYI